jgi:hypothetical protein
MESALYTLTAMLRPHGKRLDSAAGAGSGVKSGES